MVKEKKKSMAEEYADRWAEISEGLAQEATANALLMVASAAHAAALEFDLAHEHSIDATVARTKEFASILTEALVRAARYQIAEREDAAREAAHEEEVSDAADGD